MVCNITSLFLYFSYADIVTIQPVQSKVTTSNIPNQVYVPQSTTIAGLPPTIITAPAADLLIPYMVPSGSPAMTNPTQLVSGAALRPKQPANVAYSNSLSVIPNLTQGLFVGGRVIKQGGKNLKYG